MVLHVAFDHLMLWWFNLHLFRPFKNLLYHILAFCKINAVVFPTVAEKVNYIFYYIFIIFLKNITTFKPD